MMKYVALLLALTATSTFAEENDRKVTCKMRVGLEVLADGPCWFRGIGGGSFVLLTEDKSYFAYVSVEEPGWALAFWNAEQRANHAHTPLGYLKRDDACWKSNLAEFCAWK